MPAESRRPFIGSLCVLDQAILSKVKLANLDRTSLEVCGKGCLIGVTVRSVLRGTDEKDDANNCVEQTALARIHPT